MPGLKILLASAIALTQAGPAAPVAETWYRIVAAGGAQLGHVRQRSSQGPQGRETVSEQHILVENGEGTTRILETTTVRENREGRPVSISEHAQIGSSWSRLEARISADQAEIVRSTRTDRRTAIVKLPPGTRLTPDRACCAAGTRPKCRASNSSTSTSARWPSSGL
jgi:hypothetical protein